MKQAKKIILYNINSTYAPLAKIFRVLCEHELMNLHSGNRNYVTLTTVPLGLKQECTTWFCINLFLGQALHTLPALAMVRERKKYARMEESGLKITFKNFLKIETLQECLQSSWNRNSILTS